MRYILKQVMDDEVYVDFEEEVCFYDNFVERVVIAGNGDFQSFGNAELISIIKNDYYDDDLGYDYDKYEELEKVTGKKWAMREMHGYSQGDWQDVYYIEGEVSQDEIDYLEAFYMGKVDEYRVYELGDDENFDEYESDCYHAFVPHDITWKDDKKAICDYLGIDAEKSEVFKCTGYHKVADYEMIK